MPCLSPTLKNPLQLKRKDLFSEEAKTDFSGIEDQMLKAGWDTVLKGGWGQETK